MPPPIAYPQPLIDGIDPTAFAVGTANLFGLVPPNLRDENEGIARDIKGSGNEARDWITYGIDMANNATMFSPAIQQAAIKSAGRMGPVVGAMVNPSWGATTIKGNIAGGVGATGFSMVLDAGAEISKSKADELLKAVKSARFRGRYDLADKILDRVHRLNTEAEDVMAFSDGLSTGSIAGAKGAFWGGVSTLPLNVFRHAMGGAEQKVSKDEGFYAKNKKSLDDRIISLIQSGDEKSITEAKDMYKSQLDNVYRGRVSISTLDQRVRDAIDTLGDGQIGRLHEILDKIGTSHRAESENLSVEELERLSISPKLMRRKPQNFNENEVMNNNSKGFGPKLYGTRSSKKSR